MRILTEYGKRPVSLIVDDVMRRNRQHSSLEKACYLAAQEILTETQNEQESLRESVNLSADAIAAIIYKHMRQQKEI